MAQAPENLPGTIAYFRVVDATEDDPGTSELHLVNPDGSDDRTIYSIPRGLSTIYPVPLFRPDGAEIAFISPQEFACSPYNSDIFALRRDGSELRRITNAPKCEELAELPQGSVTVTVWNLLVEETVFFVYVEGAQSVQNVLVAPGAGTTVTIDNVADLGRQQFVFVKSGSGIWLYPSAYAEVIPGQTVEAAAPFQISSGSGPFALSIRSHTWAPRGDEVAYLVAAGFNEYLPAYPANGEMGHDLFTGNTTLIDGNLAWSPVSDEFLYYSILNYPHGIYRGLKGSDVATHSFVVETDYVTDIAWMPDASGFFYSTENFGYFYNQILKYDFSSDEVTVLADGSIYLTGARTSPDGRYFAFADREDDDPRYDLYGMEVTGGLRWKIASDIVSWDWGGVVTTDFERLDPVAGFRLLPNYPDPFSARTTIRYALPVTTHVTLRVFDLLGHQIAVLVDGTQESGIHTVSFEAHSYGSGLASGVYFYELTAQGEGGAVFSAAEEMLLIR